MGEKLIYRVVYYMVSDEKIVCKESFCLPSFLSDTNPNKIILSSHESGPHAMAFGEHSDTLISAYILTEKST